VSDLAGLRELALQGKWSPMTIIGLLRHIESLNNELTKCRAERDAAIDKWWEWEKVLKECGFTDEELNDSHDKVTA
jgi:malate synthase